ncbi:hypothetical protein [Streptomyces sp. MNU76]|uniref:hypothetical protein n=1 Tax=Streptomyces sp. MNU76 TaxID=2560026 RepID=UPI0027E0F92D|nr:hypothetical protein [Streptomyces sp. MNU76]
MDQVGGHGAGPALRTAPARLDRGTRLRLPDGSADTNKDGILDNTEATVHYGDINIALTVSGDTDTATSGLAVDRMQDIVADAPRARPSSPRPSSPRR